MLTVLPSTLAFNLMFALISVLDHRDAIQLQPKSAQLDISIEICDMVYHQDFKTTSDSEIILLKP